MDVGSSPFGFPKGDEPVNYSLIIFIHSDASYNYHDEDGNVHYGDLRALAQAMTLAKSLRKAEVFVFKFNPEKSLLFLIPQRNGEAFYFRNGRQAATQSYFWAKQDSTFAFESDFYRTFSQRTTAAKTILFYYGHEIPEQDAPGYNHSYPEQIFSISKFKEGIERLFADDERSRQPVDLLVLSTCYGGTPGVIKPLSGISRYILTSPDNLHLSFIDSELLIDELKRPAGRFYDWCKEFAKKAFDKLSARTRTAVSLTLYDSDKIQDALPALFGQYKRSFQPNNLNLICYDCGDNPAIAGLLPQDGVDVFYRPPQFGREKNKQQHSGWSCWKPN